MIQLRTAMEEELSGSQVRRFLLNLSDRILETKDELNRMDSACGDGDFGTSMHIAFTHLKDALTQAQSEEAGTLLTITGNAILSSAGGAAGPLFGTLFSEAGKAAKGRRELGVTELAAMFESAELKVQARGGAQVGDKTLLDALAPVIAALKKSSAEKNENLHEGLKEAAEAARKGFESTKNLVAKHGRARYLGEQTLGHPDPGAYVVALIFETLEATTK